MGLLTANDFDCQNAPTTIDRKTFLGQGMPQYEEGGLSPLALAARNGRLSTVSLLLAHSPAKLAWLGRTDSFGRDLITATCDCIALKTNPSSAVVAKLKEILNRFCLALERDVNALSIPSHSDTQTAERRRQRILRARCLLAQKRREEHEKRRGLSEIANLYSPKYNLQSLEFVPTEQMFTVSEPIDGVLTFPLLTVESCARI